MAMPATVAAQPFQPPTQAEAAAALAPATPRFSRQQLDQMLAPIALYPDELLMQVLMAATFPQQLLAADQWLQDSGNGALRGDQLVAALQPLPWDPSVKSLVALPQVVAMLTGHLDWTEALGVAFADQQIETMARVQFLRQRAIAAGRLRTTPHLIIRYQGPAIVIEPADPNLVYVPVYNPAEIYGTWPDRAYPPVYIAPPPGFVVGALGAGIGFGVGFDVVGELWGWGHPDWRRHQVVVDRSRFAHITHTPLDVVIRNGTWHRTAPVARVPEPARPRPPAAAAPHPPGTVTSATIVLRKPPSARPPGGTPPAPHAAAPAVAHPQPVPAPRPPAPAAPHPLGPAPAPPAPVAAHPHPGPPPAPHPPAPAAAHPHPGPPPAPHPPAPAAAHPPPSPPPPAHAPPAKAPPPKQEEKDKEQH